MSRIRHQIIKILTATLVIIIGQIIFKYLPMNIWGENILFDSSNHVAFTVLGLYVIWFFIDQNKSWRVPYFIFSAAIIIIMAIQRILSQNHNEIGVSLGLLIGIIGISTSEHLFKKLRF